MAKKDPRVDDYIKRTAPFARPILKHLRKIVHVGCPDVEETAAELNEAGTRKSRPRPRAKREINVPADLKAGLQKKVKARKTFENFSYNHKRNRWTGSLMRSATKRVGGDWKLRFNGWPRLNRRTGNISDFASKTEVFQSRSEV